jgi:SAM-dependent methyltransferase
MFSTEFLNQIRAHELQTYLPHFPAGARILEVGGGTGVQAKMLSERGLQVESIDVADSTYSEERVFPVVDYDGEHIPFEDRSFDVVFSSNVLEHIRNLDAMQSEFRRVLKPGGRCVHAVPSAGWRFWTSMANYVECLQRLLMSVPRLIPRNVSRSELRRPIIVAVDVAKILRQYLIVPRHGEEGNAWTELWTFSASYWRRKFRADYVIESVEPMGLFYTGHMVFGASLSIARREKLSRYLGSACNLFIVTPKGD